MQWRSPGQSRERGEKCECGEAGKGGRGTISLLVTDSSMQTTSPQGKNQEVGPLTQPEEEGGGGAEECKVWPYEQDLWVRGGGGMSAGQTGQTDQHSSTGLGKNVIIIDTMSLLTGMSVL